MPDKHSDPPVIPAHRKLRHGISEARRLDRVAKMVRFRFREMRLQYTKKSGVEKDTG